MDNIEQNKVENEESVFVSDDVFYNKKTAPIPRPKVEVGIDTENSLIDNLIHADLKTEVDLTQLEAFTNISQSRENIYQLLDTMAQDSTISAILEIYAEDATEPNDSGKIVWVESSDSDTAKYISFLLDSMNVDKNIYKWVYSLCKYGDVYLRLYHESEYEKDDIFAEKKEDDAKKKDNLNEDVQIKMHRESDHFVNYVEMYPNPAEMFELTRFGKTYGYVQAKVPVTPKDGIGAVNSFYRYHFNKRDVNLYAPSNFVHACLEDNTTRTPEEVTIFREDDVEEKEPYTYTVKRGQSLLYSTFKIWRELMLLENSLLLNRITKSSITRVISVNVGDMPEANVIPYLQKIKSLIEQKSAIDTNVSMSEYTNPGPIENNIYMPVRNEQGVISTSQIGGDVDVKSLADLDYFKNKFYGACRIPKQFIGDTDDATGFNGGTSLSIISSRYAKAIKRIQNATIHMITDVINVMLLDKGYDSMINKFAIRMQAPTTQEEIDRRDNLVNKIGVVSDLMNLLSEIQDEATKLKFLKSLLSDTITNTEIIELIQEEIDKLENGEEPADDGGGFDDDDNEPLGLGNDFKPPRPSSSPTEAPDLDMEDNEMPDLDIEENPDLGGDNLPSATDLGIDMTDMSGEI